MRLIKSSLKDTGIAPMVAEAILITITLIVASLLIIALTAVGGGPGRTPEVKFGVEVMGSDLIIRHLQGDIVIDAFTLKGGRIDWVNLEVKITGKLVETAPGKFATYNGETDGEDIDFSVGDVLVIPQEGKVEGTLMIHFKGHLLYMTTL